MGTPAHKPSPRPRTPKPDTNETLTPTNILVSRYNTKAVTITPEKKQVRVVEIQWVDAVAVGGEDWVDEEAVEPEAAPSLAIGYVINETDTSITVISLVNGNHYSHGITIPKGCITKVRELT